MHEEEDFFNLGKTNFSPEEIAEMMSPTLAKQKAQEKAHQALIVGLLSGDSEDNAGPYKLRCIVLHEEWYLPVKDDGRFEIQNTRAGEYQRLIAGVSERDGRKTERVGQGGQYVPVFFDKPERPGDYKKISGRELAHSPPANVSGLLFQLKADEPLRELGRDYFSELSAMADSVEVEERLMVEGPVEWSGIRDYNFYVVMYGQRLWISDATAQVGTHEEKFVISDDELHLAKYSGREVFSMALAETECGGITINSGYDLGYGAQAINSLKLSVGHVSRLLENGRCSFHRVPEYVVRSREEFELWLTTVYFPRPWEIIQEGSTIYARASGKDLNWSIYEATLAEKVSTVSTPRFEVKSGAAADDELGPGLSPILCPGLMAKWLYQGMSERGRKINKWTPGKSLGLGRLLSKEDIAQSHLRVKVSNELLKFMPAGAETFPRETLRSVDGADFLKWGAKATSRSWVTSGLEQAKKYSRNFVLG